MALRAKRDKDNGDRDQDYDERDDDHDSHQAGDRKEHVAKIPNRKYGFFRDDQITFLVTHEDPVITENQLQNFAKAVNDALMPEGNGRVKGLPQATSFPSLNNQEAEQSKAFLSSYAVKPVPEVARGPKVGMNTTEKAFSLITCNLAGTPDDPSRLLEIVQDLNAQLSPNPQHLEDTHPPIDGLTVYAASPNWLTSVAAES